MAKTWTERDHRTHALLEQRCLLVVREGRGLGAGREVQRSEVLARLLWAVLLLLVTAQLLDLVGNGALLRRVARVRVGVPLIALRIKRKHTQRRQHEMRPRWRNLGFDFTDNRGRYMWVENRATDRRVVRDEPRGIDRVLLPNLHSTKNVTRRLYINIDTYHKRSWGICTG